MTDRKRPRKRKRATIFAHLFQLGKYAKSQGMPVEVIPNYEKKSWRDAWLNGYYDDERSDDDGEE